MTDDKKNKKDTTKWSISQSDKISYSLTRPQRSFLIAVTWVALLLIIVTNYKVSTALIVSATAIFNVNSLVSGSKYAENALDTVGLFKPVYDGGLQSFYDVCIEDNPNSNEMAVHHLPGIIFADTKKIVVYNNQSSKTGRQFLPCPGSAATHMNHWYVHFVTSALPSSRVIMPSTAYFVSPTCPGNLHHFWQDIFVSLSSVVNKTNKLHPGAKNQIIYRRPYPINAKTGKSQCGPSKVDEIMDSLHTTGKQYVFTDIPTGTCFSSAVFGVKDLGADRMVLLNHIIAYFNLTHLKDQFHVTILQRTYRKILNIDELAAAVRQVGFKQVRVVVMEKLTVREQMAIAVSSKLLIGVNGAGLQWGMFMNPASNLIEIGWPSKHFSFYFPFITSYNIKYTAFSADNVTLNWNSYAMNVRYAEGHQFSMNETQHLLKVHPVNIHDNIYKWADVWVNVSAFTKKLQDVMVDDPMYKLKP